MEGKIAAEIAVLDCEIGDGRRVCLINDDRIGVEMREDVAARTRPARVLRGEEFERQHL
jgi:hypothetical protein